MCVTQVSMASVLAGTTAALCAFAFSPGEGAGAIDVAQVVGCIGAAASTVAATAGAIDVCLDAGCYNAVAYLYHLRQQTEQLHAKALAIATAIGVKL